MTAATRHDLRVTLGRTPLAPRAEKTRDDLLAAGLPSALLAGDPGLWGPEAEADAANRLGWLSTTGRSRALLPRLAALHSELIQDGIDHVVLCGTGGAVAGAEVICRTAGVELTVLDTTDPGQIRTALADRLMHTVVVLASKSGTTVQTDSHRRAFQQAFTDAGLSEADAGRRFVVVTDAGSPLADTATQLGARAVFLADENVGARYGALTAFGLVPAALAGADVATLLADADALATDLGTDNPALLLGALLGSAAQDGHDTVLLADADSGVRSFGPWVEQLLAESTGKRGQGLFPVVVDSPAAALDVDTEDTFVVVAVSPGLAGAVPDGAAATVAGPLGALLLGWSYATAVAGQLIGINPFDEPDVEEGSAESLRLLRTGPPAAAPAVSFGAVEVYADPELLRGADSLPAVLAAVLAAVPERGYLAVMAYLDRWADASAEDLRRVLASGTDRPVSFGWGPRCLHSTGQFHKGGRPVGAFLQITGAAVTDLPVPGRDYTFAGLQAAQAAGDLQALAARDRPAFRLHLTDRPAGIGQLLEATQ